MIATKINKSLLLGIDPVTVTKSVRCCEGLINKVSCAFINYTI